MDAILWSFLGDEILAEMLRPAPVPVFARITLAPRGRS